jgi:hypothetical protein
MSACTCASCWALDTDLSREFPEHWTHPERVRIGVAGLCQRCGKAAWVGVPR